MEMTSILDLSIELEKRDLSITIWSSSPELWVVWLFAKDDPDLGIFHGSGDSLKEAISMAFGEWDQVNPSESDKGN